MVGKRFARLTVLGFHGVDARGRFVWECRCDCGSTKPIHGNSLRSGLTQSCGCLGRERRLAATLKHNDTGSRTYQSWDAMIQRVTNPKTKAFKNYGGRGIKICDRWINSYVNFLSDMGRCPPGKTLDRKDNNGDYSPENCRWATKLEQSGNTRFCLMITHLGKTMCASAWARETGLHRNTIAWRFKRGFRLEKVFS